PRFQDLEMHLQRTRRYLYLSQQTRLGRIGRVRKHGHAGDSRNRLLEQLQPLADQLRSESGHTRDVLLRFRQAGHEPARDRIDMNRHDDGDRRRGALGRLGSGGGARDDDVHVEPNQLGGEGGEPVSVVAVESALDEDVLALDVPQLPHPLEETLPGAPAPRAVRRRTPEKAYPMDLRGLLGVGGGRPKRQADSENDREPDQPHGAPRWRMAGGSLADDG